MDSPDAHDARSPSLTPLAADEIARYRRFSSRSAAQQFLAARLLTRTALSAYADVPAHAWSFGTGEHGRPFIAEPADHSPLHFSVSHTASAVAVAVGRTPDIGIDVETVDQQVDIEAVGRVVFTVAEMTWIGAGIGAGHTASAAERFFDLWTLKEAYMKARGKGFMLNPHSFALAEVNGVFRICKPPACETDPGRWRFMLCSPRPGLRLALAFGNEARIEMVTFGAI